MKNPFPICIFVSIWHHTVINVGIVLLVSFTLLNKFRILNVKNMFLILINSLRLSLRAAFSTTSAVSVGTYEDCGAYLK